MLLVMLVWEMWEGFGMWMNVQGGEVEGEDEEGEIGEDGAHVGVIEVGCVLSAEDLVHARVLPSSWC